MRLVFALAFTALFAPLLLAPALAMDADQAERCSAMASGFKAEIEAVSALKARRDAKADETERLGEAWENAEALREFGDAEAAQADAAEAAYLKAKDAFLAAEAAFQDKGHTLNADIARFNEICAG